MEMEYWSGFTVNGWPYKFEIPMFSTNDNNQRNSLLQTEIVIPIDRNAKIDELKFHFLGNYGFAVEDQTLLFGDTVLKNRTLYDYGIDNWAHIFGKRLKSGTTFDECTLNCFSSEYRSNLTSKVLTNPTSVIWSTYRY
ncbi:hypothetical protein HDV06_006143 [Boothiomyces sp. JEL0866]|nr:hypothetical protein HDV06_006143 [Boothiomyces sp. JEL0866]